MYRRPPTPEPPEKESAVDTALAKFFGGLFKVSLKMPILMAAIYAVSAQACSDREDTARKDDQAAYAQCMKAAGATPLVRRDSDLRDVEEALGLMNKDPARDYFRPPTRAAADAFSACADKLEEGSTTTRSMQGLKWLFEAAAAASFAVALGKRALKGAVHGMDFSE